MRKLLHALTNHAPASVTPQPPTRPRAATRIWRFLPVALAFAFALTLVAQVNHPTASAQTPPAVALEGPRPLPPTAIWWLYAPNRCRAPPWTGYRRGSNIRRRKTTP